MIRRYSLIVILALTAPTTKKANKKVNKNPPFFLRTEGFYLVPLAHHEPDGIGGDAFTAPRKAHFLGSSCFYIG